MTRKEISDRYRLKHRERLAAKRRAAYKADHGGMRSKMLAEQRSPERKAYKAEWHHKNRDRINAAMKARHAANRDAILAARKAEYAAIPIEERKRLAKEYRAAHRDYLREKERKYRIKNPAVFLKIRLKATERINRYRLENMDKFRTYVRNRRAKLASAEGTHTLAEWLSLVEFHGGRCAYCGVAAVLTADHRIPVSRGGSNHIDNIVPACKSCNCRKSDRTDVEWQALQAASQP